MRERKIFFYKGQATVIFLITATTLLILSRMQRSLRRANAKDFSK